MKFALLIPQITFRSLLCSVWTTLWTRDLSIEQTKFKRFAERKWNISYTIHKLKLLRSFSLPPLPLSWLFAGCASSFPEVVFGHSTYAAINAKQVQISLPRLFYLLLWVVWMSTAQVFSSPTLFFFFFGGGGLQMYSSLWYLMHSSPEEFWYRLENLAKIGLSSHKSVVYESNLTVPIFKKAYLRDTSVQQFNPKRTPCYHVHYHCVWIVAFWKVLLRRISLSEHTSSCNEVPLSKRIAVGLCCDAR